MPSKHATKVAYVVFNGRQPGVYATWSETEKQVKGYPKNRHTGYTQAEGGLARAERELRDFLEDRGPIEDTAHTNISANTARARVIPTGQISLSLAPVQAHVLDHEPPGLQNCPSTTPPLRPIQDKSTRRKKERPSSWSADYDSPAKTQCIGNVQRDHEEKVESRSAEKHIHIDSVRVSPRSGTRSAAISFCCADTCSLEDSSSDDEMCCSTDSQEDSPDSPDSPDNTSSTGSISGDSVTDRPILDGGSVSESDPVDHSSGTKDSDEDRFDTVDSFDNADQHHEIHMAMVFVTESKPEKATAKDDDDRLQGPKHDEPAPDFIPLPSCSSDYGDLPKDHPVFTPSSALAPIVQEIKLGEEQARLVELIMSGSNVFYTGSAGVGKSTVLKCFVSRMREKGKQVDIVTPTGKAALEVDGSTFWTYAGWTPELMRKSIEKLETNARYLETVQERLRKTDVLVIDEISMFENHHFERLNRIMKSARNDEEFFGPEKAGLNSQAAFGGVQLIVTGDFCQLPPVRPFEYCIDCDREFDREARTEYRCPCCYVVFKDMDKYGQPLNAEERNLLLNHPSDTINAVRLFPRKDDVKQVNDTEFNRLQSAIRTYTCIDDFYWNKEHKELESYWIRYKKNHNTLSGLQHHPFEPRLQLRAGMLVILLVNLDFERGLVNGSQGVILGFKTHDPANLKDPLGNYSHLRKEQIKKFVDGGADKEWPLVQFCNGSRKVTRLIKAECRVHEKGHKPPYSYMHRTQIPLMAAWAMTIHKAQGMTLSRVEVNLARSFEKGQDYVALSRATSLAGLKVHGLRQREIGGNSEVMRFMRENFADDPALMDGQDIDTSRNKCSL